MLGDKTKCKDEDATDLEVLLRRLGLSEAVELEYAEHTDLQEIAGLDYVILLLLYTNSMNASLISYTIMPFTVCLLQEC